MAHDPDDTQPLPGDPKRKHRKYIPAVWKPAGTGGGHPKISGGYEVDKHGKQITTRGLNNVDQRYTQAISTVNANRIARAAAEYSETVVLQGALAQIELRSKSGNNYDLSAAGGGCDCPDQFRLDESYNPPPICKHSHIARMAMVNVGGYANLDWSVSKLAEVIGIDERTASELCMKGEVGAYKKHNVWVIPAGPLRDSGVQNYLATVHGTIPTDIPLWEEE